MNTKICQITTWSRNSVDKRMGNIRVFLILIQNS